MRGRKMTPTSTVHSNTLASSHGSVRARRRDSCPASTTGCNLRCAPLGWAPRTLLRVILLHLRRQQDFGDQLREIATGSLCCHWHERMVGHAGYSINFQQVKPALLVLHHVHASPATATDLVERLKGKCLQRFFLLGVESARAQVTRGVGFILGFVVVETIR